MEQAGVQLIAAGANVYIGDLKSATNATNTFVDATDKGSGRVSKAGEIMTGALRHIGTIAVDALAQAAKATAAFVGDSIGLAGDFEQGMLNFQAVAGKDVDAQGLEQFRDLFLDIGKRLPVSTAEVQKAAIEMVKGGIDPAIIAAGGLEQNIQFAAAAMKGDLVGAAEISAKILGGWTRVGATAAEQADFLTHSTDMLTKAANASTVDVKELALGIFNAQGIAKVAGVSFDGLTTTLAALSPRFESASQAGNSLKNMIARLQPTTDPATQAMRGLGLITKDGNNQFYDAKGNFVGMSKAGQLLQDSLKGLTKQQQASVLQTIFGNDAMGSAAGLAELGAAGYDAMAAKIEKANGVAATAALIQGSFNTKLDNTKGSIEALQITIGTVLLPVLGDLLDNYITPAINAVTDFADQIFGASDPMLAFASAIHQWSAPLGSIVFYLTELARGGEGVNAWLKETPALFQGLVGGVQGAIREFSRLSEAFNTGGISGLIDTLVADISAAIPDIAAALSGWGEALADQLLVWGEALADWVAPYIPVVIDALADLAAEAWAWVVSEAPGWGRQLMAWGEELVNWIAPMIPPAIAELGKLGMSFLGWIGDQAAPLLKSFLDWKDAFVAWIPGATVTFLAEWPKMFDDFLTWIGDQAGPLLKQLGDWALSFVGWIVPMIPGFLVTLGGVTLALGVFVIETAAVLSKKITEKWIPALLEWVVTEAVPKLYVALNDFLQVFQDWIESAQRDLANWMRAVGKSAVEGIEAGLKGAWGSLVGWITDKMSGLVDAALDAIGAHSPADAFMPVGVFGVQGIMLGFETMWPRLTAMLGDIGEDLASQAQDIADSVQSAIADAFGATASIDRQKVSNLRDVGKLDEKRRAGVQSQINEAEKIALAMNDPVEAANYFKMRSKQLIELGELGDKINTETDRAKRAQLQAEYDLINAAQQAEMKQFEAQQAATKNTTESLAQQINDLIGAFAGLKLTDNQIHAIDALSGILASLGNIPHRAGGGPVDAFMPHWVGEKGPEIFWPTMAGRISPAASSQQMAGRATSNSYSNSKTINMPIYTNQSPAVLQQSWAIMQASMT